MVDNGGTGRSEQTHVTLSHELRAFVVRLSHALQRHAIYPPGHASLEPADRSVIASLDGLLASHPQISLGVTRDGLVVEGIQTDPGQTLLKELARRFHRHHLVALTIRRGVTASDVSELLDLLCVDPVRTEPLGLLPPERAPRLNAIQLHPVRYDSLQLVDDDGTPAGSSEQMWMALATAALASEEAETASLAPSSIAQAIKSNAGSDGYDRRVTGHILGIVQRSIGGEAEEELRPRLAELVSNLDKPTLRRLIEASGGLSDQLQLMNGLTDWTAAEAVIDLAEAGAQAMDRNISDWMLRLLGKMSSLAASSGGAERVAADQTMRAVVRTIIEEWTLENPNPTEYDATLQRIAEGPPVVNMKGDQAAEIDPARVLRMSLEVRDVSTATVRSLKALILQGQPGQAIDILNDSPVDNPKLRSLWDKVATPETVRGLLAQSPPDFDHLECIVSRVGIAAAEPMLESLNQTQSRNARRRLIELLTTFGSALAPPVVRLLEDDRWFVQRNMLALLRKIDFWPEGIVAPEPFLNHSRVEVRWEAVKLLLTVPGERDRAIRSALADPSEDIQARGVEAVGDSCPRPLVPAVVAVVETQDLPAEIRQSAIRALGHSDAPEAGEALLRVTRLRRRWNLRRSLAPKTPELLLALEGLARHRQGTRAADAVLDFARGSADPEIRAAAGGPRGRDV